ncbi:hypothetical protein B566_EDAN008569 [Ephemera danica]|nr:hypothetical protein B566_EDAN008569 [Ephemera danica]
MPSVDENVALLSALGRPPYARPSPPVSSSICCFITCFLTTLAILLVGAMSYLIFHDMQATPSEDPLIHVHSAPILA